MPEIYLNRESNKTWPGSSRNDLPPRTKRGDEPNGMISTERVAFLAAEIGSLRDGGQIPPVRTLTYQFVDTGESAIHDAYVLWTDSASWCTIVSLWRMGHAGLAHVPPGPTAARDTVEFLQLFGEEQPTEIHLVTMPLHLDYEEGFVTVKNTVKDHYKEAYKDIRTYIITGYATHEWAQHHQLAVDPRSGAYPVFNRENEDKPYML